MSVKAATYYSILVMPSSANVSDSSYNSKKEQQSRRPVGFDTNSFDPANVDVPTDSDIAATAAAAAADKTNETKA